MSTKLSALVYVHGISKHGPGYSDEWFAALKPHLTIPVDTFEVLWSDLVNAKAMALGEDSAAFEANVAAEESMRADRGGTRIAKACQSPNRTRSPVGRDEGNLRGLPSFSLDDFVRYMVWEATRESILSRFDDVVLPLLREGRTIHVIAHSWGTVVSYEGLRRLDGQQFPGRVGNLIVLGSALSIGAVQRNLFGRVGDGCCPRSVAQFINVDAGGDVVGGPLAPAFQITDEFINQRPTGCSTFWLSPRTARNPLCGPSHFRENTAVNRDIIARFINQPTR